MKNNDPLVTIIIPVFNAEKYIAETIESVVSQRYTNWELIIVDDCSTDKSCEVVKRFQKEDQRINLMEIDINFGGPARPRNIGLKRAKGKYVAFLDADDVWFPQKLTRQVSFMLSNPDIDICHTLANEIDENSVVQGCFDNQKAYRKLKFLVSSKNRLFYSNNININSTIMKIDKKVFFDEDTNIIALEDWKYWIDNQQLGKKFHLLEEVLLNYRVRRHSISNRSSDISYRKATYLLSKAFLENKISLFQFLFAIALCALKIMFKKGRRIGPPPICDRSDT